MALAPTKIILYTSALSGCSARIRIAALLKGISFEDRRITSKPSLVTLSEDSQPYTSINPNSTVPTLVATYSNGQSVTITQSLSMLDFLEESYPGRVRLLPPVTDMTARLQVRDLAALVACDIQPIQNSKVQRRLATLGQDPKLWAKGMLRRGIDVYDLTTRKSAGRFSVGDEISWADLCLYPMVQRARQLGWGPEKLLGGTPTVSRIMAQLESIRSFRDGGLQNANP